MPEIAAAILVPGPEDAVLALWDDVTRWSAFVDGFRRITRADPDWPAPGSKIEWDTGPHGAGPTRETVVGPGVRSVETEQLTGTLSAAWSDGELRVALDYELKSRNLFTLLFVRRSLRDALRRTVGRYAIERRADAELAS